MSNDTPVTSIAKLLQVNDRERRKVCLRKSKQKGLVPLMVMKQSMGNMKWNSGFRKTNIEA